MNEPIWSVGLTVDDVEARALSESSVALYLLEATEGHLLRFRSPPLESDEQEAFRLEVAATTALTAEERALNVVYRARRAAGLPDKIVPVAWVAPRGDIEGEENFLDQAEELVEDEHFGIAIVAAEIHLQTQTRLLVERAIERSAAEVAPLLLQHRNTTNLDHDSGRSTIHHFLGVKVTDFPEWNAYKAHQSRRNEVVHRGAAFGESEAVASIAVVRSLWIWLAKASREAEDVAIDSRPGLPASGAS